MFSRGRLATRNAERMILRCWQGAAPQRVHMSQAARQVKTPPASNRQPLAVPAAKDVSESVRLKTEIMDTLYRHHQRPVPTVKNNVILTNCPHCVKIRKNSFAAYLDLNRGTYHCKTCKSTGTWNEFSATLQKAHAREPHFELLSTANVLGSRPASFSRATEDIEAFPAHLWHNEALLKRLCDTHKIRPEVWRLYGVGLATYNDPNAQLADAPEQDRPPAHRQCLTFPQTALTYSQQQGKDKDHLFRIETMRLKMGALEQPAEVVTFDPPIANQGAPAGLFGYQTATAEHDAIILTRHELDAMAAYQGTGLPSFSLPTSNYQLQENVLPLLERFSRVYLWLDDDVNGQLAAERFARKLGEPRCMIVNTRMGAQEGPVGAYEALQQGHDLLAKVKAARRLKHDQIVDFHDLRGEVYREILNPDQTRGVQSTELPAINDILKGHRSGELTILTGPTGAGKTTIISQLSLDYCQSGVPTLWGSFEILNKRLAKKMLYQFAGKDLSKTPAEIDAWADKFEQLPLYFLKFFSSTAIKDVLKACSHAVYAYDVRHIILDNLQFMLSQQGRSSLDRWELQDEAIAELRRFATQQDVHITLVVHPRKDPGEMLDINSVFGSAKVTQEADNVVIIQKNEHLGELRRLDIKKNRFDGTLGSIPYKFVPESLKIRAYTAEETAALQRAPPRHQSSTEQIYPRRTRTGYRS